MELIFSNLQKLFDSLYILYLRSRQSIFTKIEIQHIYILIIETFYNNSFAFDIFTILETSNYFRYLYDEFNIKEAWKKKKMKKEPQKLNKKVNRTTKRYKKVKEVRKIEKSRIQPKQKKIKE